MKLIQTHASVRLRPGEGTDRRPVWIADHLLHRRQFRLSTPAAALLTTCFTARDESSAVEQVVKLLKVPPESVQWFIPVLEDKGLLVSVGDPSQDSVQRNAKTFWNHQWIAAWDYHLVTHDYPFLDYTLDGREIDLAGMKAYTNMEHDMNRSKRLPMAIARISLPEARKQVLPETFTMQWSTIQAAPSDWAATEIKRLLTMVFGRVGYIKPPWPNASLAFRKTSPSGGARHPTEAYVVVLDVGGLDRGWYHVSTAETELELFDTDVQDRELQQLFAGAYCRASFRVRAIVVMTSVFERNMYRYREPRTFRSVHLDVGHLCSSLEIAARTLGIRSFAHYGINEQGLETRLGLRPLDEGVFMAVALG